LGYHLVTQEISGVGPSVKPLQKLELKVYLAQGNANLDLLDIFYMARNFKGSEAPHDE